MSFLDRILRGGRAPRGPTGDPLRVAQAEAALARLRPMLRADGGDVELVEVRADGVIGLRFRGACRRCPAQAQTFELGLEPLLRRELEWMRGLELV